MTKKVAEPAIAYNTSYVQGLKNRIIATIDQTNDEEKLEQCLQILSGMPCIYSDEEFDQILEEAEIEEYASEEEVSTMFARWKN